MGHSDGGWKWTAGSGSMQVIGDFDASYLDAQFCANLFPALLADTIHTSFPST